MTPLFDKYANLFGWLSEDEKNIFNKKMDWVAFIADDKSVWNVQNQSWVGHLYGKNIRDYEGKTLFWNPDTPIENTTKPLKPFKPFMPFRPFKPFKPFDPFSPFIPNEPTGGWSKLSWNDFVNG